MNDKKRNELIEVLSTTDGKNKALQGLKDKITELDDATETYDKSKAAHKKEFLALSKERTALEVVKDEIAAGQEKTKKNLSLSLDIVSANVAAKDALAERETELASLEKKTKASCRRKETAAEKALAEAETLKAEAQELKSKYEAQYKKLQDAMNG